MTRKPKLDKQLTQVLAAIRDHVGPGRSPLYHWMRQRHAALAAAFDETPPAWAAFAAQMALLGITDANGKPPTAMSARQTWYRVRRDAAARAAKRAQATLPLAPSEIARGVNRIAVQPNPEAAGEVMHAPRARPRLDIRPATPLSSVSPVLLAAPLPQPPGSAPDIAMTDAMHGAAAGDDDVAAQLQRLHDQMSAGKLRLPKVVP